MKTIIQIGLKRSGNHGLLNLIKKSFTNDNIVHLNDISVFSYKLYEKYSQIEVSKREKNNKWGGFKNADLILISIENKNIDKLFVELKKFNHLPNFHVIVLLRNPYNNASSVYQYFLKIQCAEKDRLTKILINEWITYALFILTYQFVGNTIPIIYDKFYKDEQYRKDIFEYLDLNYKKEHLNQVTGWGVSFFERNCKDTSKMNIFTRFLVFQNNSFFIQNIFRNKDLFDLWTEICRKFNLKLDPTLVCQMKHIYENGGNTQ